MEKQTINSIIGAEKAFEPPFRVQYNTIYKFNELRDKSGNLAMMMSCDIESEIILANHICDLLNREHVKQIPD